jgi:hypothetical protein
MNTGAILSACRTYRYVLWREWDKHRPPFVVIGLNPSTADETQDDPTIRRCLGFARREGCGRLAMLNLFALRATDPRVLRTHSAPIGIDNDRHILDAGSIPDAVIVSAWGVHGTLHDRDVWVAGLISAPLWCLGTSKAGHPRHPLYLPSDAPLVSFNPEAARRVA